MSKENFGSSPEKRKKHDSSRLEQDYEKYQKFIQELSVLTLVEDDSQKLIGTVLSFKDTILGPIESKGKNIKIEEIDALTLGKAEKLYQEYQVNKKDFEEKINSKIEGLLANLKNLEGIQKLDEFINKISVLRANFEEIDFDLREFEILELKINNLSRQLADLKLREKGFDSYESFLLYLENLSEKYQQLENQESKLEDSVRMPWVGKTLSYFINKKQFHNLKEQKDNLLEETRELNELRKEIDNFYLQKENNLYYKFFDLKTKILTLLFKRTQENFQENFEKIFKIVKNAENFLQNKIELLPSEIKQNFSQELKFFLNSFRFFLFRNLGKNYSFLWNLFKNFHEKELYINGQFYDSAFNENLKFVNSEVDRISNLFSDFDSKKWETFKNNPEIEKFLSQDIINLTENILVDSFIDELVYRKLDRRNRSKISYNLFKFKTPKAIFFNILNSFVEKGESGDYPFIFGRENCALLRYLKSLSPEQIGSFRDFYKESYDLKKLISFIEKLRIKNDFQDDDYYELIEKTFDLSSRFLENDNGDFRDLIFSVFRILFNQHGKILNNLEETLNYNQALGLLEFLSQNPDFILRNDFYFGLKTALKKEVFEIILKNINNLNKEIFSFLKNHGVIIASLFIEDENLNFVSGVLSKLNNLSVEDFEQGARVIFFLEEVLESPESSKILVDKIDEDFLNLIKPGGPLYLNRELVFKEIILNPNPLFTIFQIKNYFSKKIPYWKLLFSYTRLRLKKEIEFSFSDYPVREISGITLKNIRAERLLEMLTENAPEDLKRMIKDGKIEFLHFKYLTPQVRMLVLRDFLKRTIEFSRSEELKAEADKRNRELVKKKRELSFQDGMNLHGSAIDFLDSVLLNGNLPGEALGEAASADSYPFHVDFTKLTEKFILDHEKNTRQIILNSLSAYYGINGKLGEKGQIFYFYPKPSERIWEKNVDYSLASGDHTLILGGVPSTEILGIVLTHPEATLEMAKKRIIENGFYIPLYDLDGNLIFSPEEYDYLYNNFNMAVPVEIWDFSLKTGNQRGSNPGAEYTLPAKNKKSQSEKYYVKFASLDEQERLDQLWCEFLADKIYRIFDIPVPETKIVKVEGVYGRASRLMEVIEDANKNLILGSHDLLDGFLLDVLLSNLDVLYTATQNVILSKDNHVYRIDNGGSLIFRARGERKNIPDLINEEKFKKELEDLTKKDEFKLLTLDDLKQQAQKIKTLLTDEKIQELVNSVRLSHKDRTLISEILKIRRDFILRYYQI